MKKLAAFCSLLVLSLASQARADLVIVESVETGEGPHDFIMSIKGNQVRTDVSTIFSTITDLKTGDTISLHHSDKSYVKLTGANTKQIMQGIKDTNGAAADTVAAKLTDTGRREKVGEFSAEIYTAEAGEMKWVFWMSTDVPNYTMLRDQMKKVQAAHDKMGKGLDATPDTSTLDGFPVKTEVISHGNFYATLFVSAKEQPVDDKEFQIPPDYIEITMPDPATSGSGRPAGTAPAVPTAPVSPASPAPAKPTR